MDDSVNGSSADRLSLILHNHKSWLPGLSKKCLSESLDSGTGPTVRVSTLIKFSKIISAAIKNKKKLENIVSLKHSSHDS